MLFLDGIDTVSSFVSIIFATKNFSRENSCCFIHCHQRDSFIHTVRCSSFLQERTQLC